MLLIGEPSVPTTRLCLLVRQEPASKPEPRQSHWCRAGHELATRQRSNASSPSPLITACLQTLTATPRGMRGRFLQRGLLLPPPKIGPVNEHEHTLTFAVL